jgi:hypothetical protein
MARKPCSFRVTDVRRGVDAVKGAGLPVSGVKYEKDSLWSSLVSRRRPRRRSRTALIRCSGVRHERLARE